MSSSSIRFRLADPKHVGKRLDAVLAEVLPDLSRSRLQALIKQGHVCIDQRPVKARRPVVLDEEVEISIPEAEPSENLPEAMDLNILFEDAHLLVLDKPSGLVVHPGAGHATGTLVNALLAHCGALSTIGGVERPGIVHRLDKDTSGCMVVAKNDLAHQRLSAQFADRQVEKHYLAVGRGSPSASSGHVENHLGRHPVNRQKMAVVESSRGKPAVTDYHCGPCADDATLVHCQLHTGRTHQIRVHLHSLGHPLLGDVIYGRATKGGSSADRLLLHSWILGFRHPVSGEPMVWRSEIPEAFAPWLIDPKWVEERASVVGVPGD
ncbi:MAG: 23S rRNA pseudouridine1911/1915/1917 synthase [Verrucomicrobiales bacterium]|jgi:23S rRNA pseudouridine1911/1915/1917 synthase